MRALVTLSAMTSTAYGCLTLKPGKVGRIMGMDRWRTGLTRRLPHRYKVRLGTQVPCAQSYSVHHGLVRRALRKPYEPGLSAWSGILLLLLGCPSVAQAAGPPDPPSCPTVIMGIGGGVIRNAGQTSTGEGTLEAQVDVAACNYVGTTIDMKNVNGVASNVVTLDYEHLFPFGKLPSGPAIWLVGLDASAGTSTTPPIIGSFAAGGSLRWNLGYIGHKWLRTSILDFIWLTGKVRVLTTSSSVSTATSSANGVTTTTTVTSTPTALVGQSNLEGWATLSFSW